MSIVTVSYTHLDPVINPYIVFALVINAGLKGIENQEELVDAIDLDLYNLETNNTVSYTHLCDL